MTGLEALMAGARSETRRLMTRPWDVVVAFALPLGVLLIIAAMLGPGVMRHIPIAVVDQDQSGFSRAAIANMAASPNLDIAYMPATVDEAVALIRQGKVYGFTHIPSGFTEAAFRRPTQVTLYFNGAYQTVGSLASVHQGTAIAAAAAPRLEARARQLGLPASALSPPEVQVSIIGNPQLSFELFLGGLLAPGVLHLIAACSAVLAIGRLMHGKSFQGFRAQMQGRMIWGMCGYLLPHFVIFSLWGLAWVAYLTGIRGWGIPGSALVLVLGMLALMAVSVALSAALVALLGDLDLSFSVTAIYSGAAIAFSNGTLPLDHGPRFARVWSEILPYTHYLRLQTGQMVTGSHASSGLWDLLTLVLVTLGALCLAGVMVHVRAKRAPKPDALMFDLPAQGVAASFIATFRALPKARPVASLLILAVVLYAFYYPAAYAGQAPAGLPVAIVSDPSTSLTRNLARDLEASHGVQVAAIIPSATIARSMMQQGVVDGVILIPDGFEASLSRGDPDGIAVWLNGGYLVRATAVGKSVAAALAHVAETKAEGLPQTARALSLAPEVAQVSLFNPTAGYGSYAVPAVSLIILQQTLLLGAGVIVAIRRETGAVRQRLSSKLGLWLALTTIGTLSGLFYFGFVFWFQDYPRAGNIWGAIALTPLFAAAVSALGLNLGRMFDRHERVLQVLVGTSAPLFFLAGVAWPHFMMPDWLVSLAYLSPSTPAVQAFVSLNAMGATLGEVALPVMGLGILALIFGALWLVQPRFGRGRRTRA